MSDWERQLIIRADRLLSQAVHDQDRVERRKEGSGVTPLLDDAMRWLCVRDALSLLRKIDLTTGE